MRFSGIYLTYHLFERRIIKFSRLLELNVSDKVQWDISGLPFVRNKGYLVIWITRDKCVNTNSLVISLI